MTRRHHLVPGLLVALAVAATACSGPNPNPDASPSAPGPTPTAPTPTVPPGSAAPVTGPYAPTIDPGAFRATVDNPFFPLRPGMTWEYRTSTADGLETTIVTVTTATKTIMGIVCVEVRDTVRLDGQLKEDTFDWYAQHRDGTVWYFGEDTKEYEDGKVVSTKGSWTAGVAGAHPGIVMPAQPNVGDRYRQEYLAGQAEDMAEVLSTNEQATVPTGTYTGIVTTRDTTPLEPDLLETKYYARGVGVVLVVDVHGGGTRDELVRFSS